MHRNEVKTNKKVRQLQDRSLGTKSTMGEFVHACRDELKSESFSNKLITIKKPDFVPALSTLKHDLLSLNDLSFKLTAGDAARIVNDIIKLTTDPLSVISLLRGLDTALGQELLKNNIFFTDSDYPDYLITGNGNFIPGPPPEHYNPKKKQQLLNNLLLQNEQRNGINEGGAAPRFVGFVDNKAADTLVASGHVFTEDKQMTRILLHGSLSHRLMFYVICMAVETNLVNLQLADGKKLTTQQVLELLVRGKYYQRMQNRILDVNSASLWTLTLDAVIDTINSPSNSNLYDANLYNFSCRSPFVFNSLLLCFGNELGLPNLQHYMLDSHWKSAYAMVLRVKNSNTGNNIPNNRIYTYCMEALSTTRGDPGEIGEINTSLPFTLAAAKARSNPAYEQFATNYSENIVKKKLRSSVATGEYASWDDFFAHENQKQPSVVTTATPNTVTEMPTSAGGRVMETPFAAASSQSTVTELNSHGLHSPAPSSPAKAIVKLFKENADPAHADDVNFLQTMEHQLSAKSSKLQLAIIILDYIEKKKPNLSTTMREVIDNVLNQLLAEEKNTAVVRPQIRY